MLNRVGILLAFGLFVAIPATSSAASLAEAFGNTILFTYDESGKTSELWLKADGTFALDSRTPHHYHGHWFLRESSFCLKASGLESLLPAECYAIPPSPLGLHDPAWRQMMPVGGMAHVKLVPGHFVPVRH